MTRYVYCFGYKTDSQMQDDDAESTGVFVIEAKAGQPALEWGRILSSWYVENINRELDAKVWRENCYANWIEEAPDFELLKTVSRLAPVKVGEYPDLSIVRSILGDNNS